MALQPDAGSTGAGGGPPADVLKPGTILRQRYKIVSLSNEGRNFRAYLAEDQKTMSTVTVKALRATPAEAEKAVQQFKAEFESLKTLQHPALPRLFDLFEEQGKFYMVLERVDARSLQELIESQGGPATMQQTLSWLWELLEAVDYLHNQDPPIIHRDLQPSTIMITEQGHLKLLDFGIAKIADRRDSRTLYGSAGNPAYAPMDQFSLKRSDPRMDIFSAGASFYFALSGQIPPPASERVLKALPLLELHKINPTVSEKMNTLIHKMMSVKAADRPRDAEAVRKLLGMAPPTEPTVKPIGSLPPEPPATPGEKPAAPVARELATPETIRQRPTPPAPATPAPPMPGAATPVAPAPPAPVAAPRSRPAPLTATAAPPTYVSMNRRLSDDGAVRSTAERLKVALIVTGVIFVCCALAVGSLASHLEGSVGYASRVGSSVLNGHWLAAWHAYDKAPAKADNSEVATLFLFMAVGTLCVLASLGLLGGYLSARRSHDDDDF